MMKDRYTYIINLIKALNNVRYLKGALRADIIRQQNCIKHFNECGYKDATDNNCNNCALYGDDWKSFTALIYRLPKGRIQSKLLALTLINKACTTLRKSGECSGECEACIHTLRLL